MIKHHKLTLSANLKHAGLLKVFAVTFSSRKESQDYNGQVVVISYLQGFVGYLSYATVCVLHDEHVKNLFSVLLCVRWCPSFLHRSLACSAV